MGFNWKAAGLVWLSLMGVQFLPTPKTRALADVGVVLLVVAAMLISKVARHNLSQAFKRGGHQWRGDGRECEICKE